MTDTSLRIAFAGTSVFAADHLENLVQQGHNIVGVFTQPDRPSGRGKKIQPTPVKQVASNHGITVLQPQHPNEFAESALSSLNADVLIVVAYGLILKQEILDTPRFGCINVHASLLPRWRGAAPIERAILAGDNETGVCIMQMNAGLDTGDILLRLSTSITPEDNALTLSERLVTLGCQGLNEVLCDIPQFQSRAVIQDDLAATYAAKLSRQEALIDWSKPAKEIHNQVQAFYPRSPAYFIHDNQQIRIISAQLDGMQTDSPFGCVLEVDKNRLLISCGSDALDISTLQLPGKKPAGLADILNGHPDLFSPGMSLGNV
ncbi:MAG: methionyl-tRNA formyltransferase [Gammaproteobacteria bacterium]|nr:methionyl-tRNA formyltransferase [Gammaproteobacteria bacterium]